MNQDEYVVLIKHKGMNTMKLTGTQQSILESIEANSCTEISQDDAFQHGLSQCLTSQEVNNYLQNTAYYLGLIDTYSTNRPVKEWYWN